MTRTRTTAPTARLIADAVEATILTPDHLDAILEALFPDEDTVAERGTDAPDIDDLVDAVSDRADMWGWGPIPHFDGDILATHRTAMAMDRSALVTASPLDLDPYGSRAAVTAAIRLIHGAWSACVAAAVPTIPRPAHLDRQLLLEPTLSGTAEQAGVRAILTAAMAPTVVAGPVTVIAALHAYNLRGMGLAVDTTVTAAGRRVRVHVSVTIEARGETGWQAVAVATHRSDDGDWSTYSPMVARSDVDDPSRAEADRAMMRALSAVAVASGEQIREVAEELDSRA